ncbi:MAG: hypothetical protein U1E78_03930 [Gammaproteobacteria bacterium]
MIFRVPAYALASYSKARGAERLRSRSVHKAHDCDENPEGNPPTLLRATDRQATPKIQL